MLPHVGEADREKRESPLERPESPGYYERLLNDVPWYHKIFLNRPLKIGLVMALLAVVAPVLIFYFLYENIYVRANVTDGYSSGTCSHRSVHRIPCGKENANATECPDNCCFDEGSLLCYHYMPSRYSYILPEEWDDSALLAPRFSDLPYNNAKSIKPLRLYVDEISDSHLNFILYDSNKIKFPNEGRRLADKKYFYKIYHPELFLEIFEEGKNNSKPLLSTVRGPLIAAEHIWEWSLHLTDDLLYGMGDLILEPGTFDVVYNRKGKSSTVPFVMAQNNGSFHGVYLEHRGPLEYNVTDSRVLTVKSLSGYMINVHFFMGPEPSEVLQQFQHYTKVPEIPPYWALGAHFCRGDTAAGGVSPALAEFRNFSERAAAEQLPYDSDCLGEELFQYLDTRANSSDAEDLADAIQLLSNSSKRFLPSLRPHIHLDNTSSIYLSAVEENLLIMDPDTGAPVTSLVDGLEVVFPDFSNANKISSWLNKSWPFASLTDSVILTDNWPWLGNYTGPCDVQLPYVSDKINSSFCQSLPWNAIHPSSPNISHMEIHNLYGENHAQAIHSVIDSQPSINPLSHFLLTSSNVVGSSFGVHHQNVTTSWSKMKKSFQQAVGLSILGSYIQSVPVCGDTENFDQVDMEHICLKWYLASVILPVFRVNSNVFRRDPFVFSGFAKNVMIKAIQMRYKLLPYYYTVLNRNTPLLRPMFYDFYSDNNTYAIDNVFMVGKSLLVAPNFLPSQSSVNVYLPINYTFYEMWGGSLVVPAQESGWIEIPTWESELVMLIKGGAVLPIQETVLQSAAETRLVSNYTLVVALNNCTSDENATCQSSGELFIADSQYCAFTADRKQITIDPNIEATRPFLCGGAGAVSSSVIDTIRVYGLDEGLNNFGDYYMRTNLALDMCSLKDSEVVTIDYSSNFY